MDFSMEARLRRPEGNINQKLALAEVLAHAWQSKCNATLAAKRGLNFYFNSPACSLTTGWPGGTWVSGLRRRTWFRPRSSLDFREADRIFRATDGLAIRCGALLLRISPRQRSVQPEAGCGYQQRCSSSGWPGDVEKGANDTGAN